MVRKYIRKRPIPADREEAIKKARAMVAKGKPVSHAAAATNVPYETLRRRINGLNQTERIGSGRFVSVLSMTEEKDIIDALLLSSSLFGWTCGTKEIQTMVKKYLDTAGRKTVFKNNMPGKDWMITFKRRWSQKLASGKPDILIKAAQKDLSAVAPNSTEENKKASQNSKRKRKCAQPLRSDVLTIEDEPVCLQMEAEEREVNKDENIKIQKKIHRKCQKRESVSRENTSGDKGKVSGNKEKISSDKAKSSGVKEKISGDKEKASGDKTKTSGNKAKTSGNKAKASGVKAKTSGVKAKTSGVKAKTSGVKAKTSGVKAKTSGVKAKTSGGKDKASGDKEKASGDKEKASGDKETASGDKETASGDKENASGDKENASGDKENTSGDKEKASGDKEKTSGDKTKASGDDKDENKAK
ncbi:axoneme-associated protein mst101(2) [Octopus sinensis]|uniref:Axoneme-associated protein mst101(2) n=1 Tax=Octopus sinensis TaxID=2607531 RepID=A0A6P7TTT0_9MOLL|nr:axoneme-associated protein mst101(2) [Octopus sinensis]